MFEKLKAKFSKAKPVEEEVYVPEDEELADTFDPGYVPSEDEPGYVPGHSTEACNE